MATIVAIVSDDNVNCIFLNENYRILIKISLKYVLSSQIDINRALIQVMVWRQTGDKPSPEPMMTQFIDAYPNNLVIDLDDGLVLNRHQAIISTNDPVH